MPQVLRHNCQSKARHKVGDTPSSTTAHPPRTRYRPRRRRWISSTVTGSVFVWRRRRRLRSAWTQIRLRRRQYWRFLLGMRSGMGRMAVR